MVFLFPALFSVVSFTCGLVCFVLRGRLLGSPSVAHKGVVVEVPQPVIDAQRLFLLEKALDFPLPSVWNNRLPEGCTKATVCHLPGAVQAPEVRRFGGRPLLCRSPKVNFHIFFLP